MPGIDTPRGYRLNAIRALAHAHDARSLDLTYRGREFPRDAVAFKLGGHGAELGHVHVDFMKIDERWVLKEIWLCR